VRIHQYTIMSAPTTAQDAAIEALKSGEQIRGRNGGRIRPPPQTARGGLNRLGLQTFEPRGAFYAFPNIQASGMDDETFAENC
jgi:aminotransferase